MKNDDFGATRCVRRERSRCAKRDAALCAGDGGRWHGPHREHQLRDWAQVRITADVPSFLDVIYGVLRSDFECVLAARSIRLATAYTVPANGR